MWQRGVSEHHMFQSASSVMLKYKMQCLNALEISVTECKCSKKLIKKSNINKNINIT